MKSIRAAVGILLLGVAPGLAAPASWIEIKSQHFTVVTNSGEKEGRQTLWQFEQIRQALMVIWPWATIDGGTPVTILAVHDEATIQSLGPQYWEGKRYRPTSFWVGGSDRNYIVLRTDIPEPDDVGLNPYQTAYWNYVSLVFHRSLPVEVPRWYSRGVADVLSNTIVREKELHVGRLMSTRLQQVREGPLVPLAEFLAADRSSRYARSETDSWQFDAQAWTFVHFLMFGNRGEHGGRVDRFNHLLKQGVSADVAMKEAFGPDMTPYFAGMKEYIRKQIFQYARIPVALDLRPESFASRPVAPVESSLLRARVLAAMSRPVEARAAAAEAAKADPQSPGPQEIEGLLLDREGKAADAQAAYEKAIRLGSNRGQVFYRLAQLTRPAGDVDRATNEKIAGYLDKAIGLEPDFANALSYLADVKSDLGDSLSAIELAQKAVRIAPEVSYHRLALARALWNSGRLDEAVGYARSAMAAADDDVERANAQRFLDFAAQAPRPEPRPAVVPTLPLAPSAASPSPGPGGATAIRVDPTMARDVNDCITKRQDASCARAAVALQAQCVNKEGYACRALGSLLDGGFGVPMNKAEAARAYDAGCRAFDSPSCARYAVLQVQGLGVQHDSVAGLATLERLCGEGVDDACIGWALVLAARPVNRDVPKARSLLQQVCDRTNEEACRLLKTMPAR